MVAGQRPETKGQTDCVELPAQETGQANIYTMGAAVGRPLSIFPVFLFLSGGLCDSTTGHLFASRMTSSSEKTMRSLLMLLGSFPTYRRKHQKQTPKRHTRKQRGQKQVSVLLSSKEGMGGRGRGEEGAGGGRGALGEKQVIV